MSGKRVSLENIYLGPHYLNRQVEKIIIKPPLEYEYYQGYSEEFIKRCVSYWSVGWFQGEMDFGARALGNCSILADSGM